VILSGNEIKKQIEIGNIGIEPFDEKLINPASINFRLGNELHIYKMPIMFNVYGDNVPCEKITFNGDYILQPNYLYLAKTMEKIMVKNFAATCDGRSSLGRLFMSIHQTAGFIDPGYSGFITLEISVMRPTLIKSGMEIGQFVFHTLQGEITPYNGKYQNNDGIQASMINKDRSVK